jgi:hypothetical protein
LLKSLTLINIETGMMTAKTFGAIINGGCVFPPIMIRKFDAIAGSYHKDSGVLRCPVPGRSHFA